MPTSLWKDSVDGSPGSPIQAADGVIDWGQRYSLATGGKSIRKTSTHRFMVSASSVLHFVVDTGRSGALVQYRLLDG